MRNFEFIHIINYIIEKEIHIFVHENNYHIPFVGMNYKKSSTFCTFFVKNVQKMAATYQTEANRQIEEAQKNVIYDLNKKGKKGRGRKGNCNPLPPLFP